MTATLAQFGGASTNFQTGSFAFLPQLKMNPTSAPNPLQNNLSATQTLADRYRITKKVGDGTFGEVSLAKKLDTGDLVAIKRF